MLVEHTQLHTDVRALPSLKVQTSTDSWLVKKRCNSLSPPLSFSIFGARPGATPRALVAGGADGSPGSHCSGEWEERRGVVWEGDGCCGVSCRAQLKCAVTCRCNVARHAVRASLRLLCQGAATTGCMLRISRHVTPMRLTCVHMSLLHSLVASSLTLFAAGPL